MSPVAPEAQYIIDRCDGKSYGPDSPKPLLPCFWVPPCVKYCPGCLETNCLCRTVGRIGVFPEKSMIGRTSARTKIMTCGMVSNLVGLALSIVAAFALSNSFDVLTSTGWSQGTVKGINITGFETVSIYTGLSGVAADNQNTVGKVVTGFDEFCDQLDNGLGRYINPDECDACEEASSAYRASIITTVVFYLPSIFTNWTRMFVNYDVNCQKFFGTIIAAISLALAVFSMFGYKNDCWDGFYRGDVNYFASNYTVVPEGYDGDEAIVVANFSWEPGTGFICLSVATVLKFCDLLGHCLVQTPTITRNKDEQLEYAQKYGDGNDAEGGQAAKEEGSK